MSIFKKHDSKDSSEIKYSLPTVPVYPGALVRTRLLCGTKERWESRRFDYPEAVPISPIELYVDRGHVYLITTQEWVDWLTGASDICPATEEVQTHGMES